MKQTVKIALTLVTAICVIGIAGYALAGWGHGPGRGGRGGHMMGYGGPGNCPGYGAGPAPEEYQAYEQRRSEFLQETEGLRQERYAKQLELRSELAKENPDVAKASELQKDISNLEAQIDQKRLDHAIKNRDAAPGYGRGYGMGYGRGYGRGGHMRGCGPGACWR
jgi:hypothetical protein